MKKRHIVSTTFNNSKHLFLMLSCNFYDSRDLQKVLCVYDTLFLHIVFSTCSVIVSYIIITVLILYKVAWGLFQYVFHLFLLFSIMCACVWIIIFISSRFFFFFSSYVGFRKSFLDILCVLYDCTSKGSKPFFYLRKASVFMKTNFVLIIFMTKK